MNEIFKSKVGLKQELNVTKRVKTLYFNIESGMRMDVSVNERMCLLDERTCLFRTVASVLTKWICLFGDNPFRPNECDYSANGCVCSERLRSF